MTPYLCLLLCSIFIVLSFIHLNWALGGQWGFAAALPTNEQGERILNPGKMDSLIVGIGLLVFASLYLVQTGFTALELPAWIFKYGRWIIPSIFLLRAIGDFKYVGLFRKIRNTYFGRMDAKLFTPLCLFIGILGFVVAIWA